MIQTTREDALVQLNIDRCLQVIAFSILYYDYLLTVTSEVERYWIPLAGGSSPRHVFTWTTFLFLFTRYLGILGHIPVGMEMFWPIHTSFCNVLTTYHQCFSVVVQVSIGAILILRTYALYSRRIWVLWLTCSIAALTIGMGAYAIVQKHTSAAPDPPPINLGCNFTISTSQGHYIALAWSGMLLFDIVVFILTLRKAVALRKTGRRSLTDIFFRDGTVYFGCMAIANLSNILTYLLGPPLIKGLTTTLTNVVSLILISHLMLNIRDPKLGGSDSQTIPGASMQDTVEPGPSGGVFVISTMYALEEGSYSPDLSPTTSSTDSTVHYIDVSQALGGGGRHRW